MGQKLSTGQRWYREDYLHSWHWEKVRKQVIERNGYYCTIIQCRMPAWLRYFNPLDFHHLSYTKIGRPDEADDVVIVCRLHHNLCHIKWFRRLPLKRKHLATRYFQLKHATWRRYRPSDIINVIVDMYKV